MENSLDQTHNENYPIILYQPNIETAPLALENMESVHTFSDLHDVLIFAQSLQSSFLLIVPNSTEEEKLFQYFQVLENTYPRRLASFEEDSILSELPLLPNQKVYVYITRDDFEGEILNSEEIEAVFTGSNIKEVSKNFREEFVLWEFLRNKQGDIYEGVEGSKLKTLKATYDFTKSQELRDCKEFCIRALKDLAVKRKREKLKMMLYVNLEDSCRGLEESQESLEYHEKIFGIIRPMCGESHLSTASSYMRIASAHIKLKEYQRVLELSTKALKIRKSILGELNPKTASAYSSIGVAWKMLGDYQLASEYSLKAFDIRKSIHGESHVETASSYKDLGSLASIMREYQKSIEYYTLALDIEKSVHGEMYPTIATSYTNIASSLYSLGENHKALEFCCKALEIKERIFGDKDPSILISYTNLVAGYFNVHEHKKALEYCFKAINLSRTVNGEIHPKTEAIYKLFVRVFGAQRDLEQVLKYKEKALGVKALLEGGISPEIARSYADLADGCRSVGRYQKALEFELKSLNVKRVVHGEDHPQTENGYRNLGEIYDGLKENQLHGMKYDLASVDISQFIFGELSAISKDAMEIEEVGDGDKIKAKYSE